MAEDREPIRIRNKKLTFEFERNKSWKRDRWGEQWKPTPPDAEETGGFTVEVEEPRGCVIPPAREIALDVRIDDKPHIFRIYSQRNFDPFSGAFLRTEPKLDSPVRLRSFEANRKLRLADEKDVHIAGIYADGTKVPCDFPEDRPVLLSVKPQAGERGGVSVRFGIAIAGLIAAGLATLLLQRRRDDAKGMRRRPRREERPPIRVRNKKLLFDHDREWKRDGSDRKWKPDDPHGNRTSHFEVTLIAPAKSFPPFHAREVTIEVTIDGTTRSFRLLHERAVPTLTSSVDLEPTNARKRLKFKVDKEVWISRVRGDGVVKWEFDSTEPEIVFEAQPRR